MRTICISVYLAIASLFCCPDSARAQNGVTEAQRNEFGRVFGAAPLKGSKANLAEMRTLLDAQEMRMALPAKSSKFKSFIESSRALSAITSGAAPELGTLLAWNEVALQATALDHYNPDPAAVPPPSAFGEQFGPPRTSRALAIVHLAMFEAVNTISRNYQSYNHLQDTIIQKSGVPKNNITPMTASKNRAIIEAAFQTLIKLYPAKRSLFDNAYALYVPTAGNPADPRIVLGAVIGNQAAQAVLSIRKNDGSELPDLTATDFTSDNPATWQQDPISLLKPALGGNWWRLKPFLMDSGSAHRSVLRGPPAFDSAKFIKAYKDVKTLGGDPNAPTSGNRWPTPTTRTGADHPGNPMPADNTNQTFVGIFWGYDGTALLCAPPRLYNMMATSIALNEQKIDNVDEMSLYLALVNVTLADAAIAAWDAKYYFLYPRPVTYIRSVDADQTSEGARDPRWTPLGAPVTNGTPDGRNLTPPFPAYPSGHAVFGGAFFEVVTLFFKSRDPMFPAVGIPFKFVSDEYNGVNRGPGDDNPRPRIEVNFTSFKQAQDLNSNSRIFIGVHWQFDADDGVEQGRAVGQDVISKFVKSPTP